jgi:predicted Rossmann fold nucleotide-binding protein DprA/Smf involved in DNA uptake
LIRDGRDVLDALLGPSVAQERAAERRRARVDDALAPFLDAIETGAATQDEIARECGARADEAAVALTRLELLGLVACDAAGRYRARGEA